MSSVFEKLIIGIDYAKPGSQDESCMVLRVGDKTHIIPEPFATPLMEQILVHQTMRGEAYQKAKDLILRQEKGQ